MPPSQASALVRELVDQQTDRPAQPPAIAGPSAVFAQYAPVEVAASGEEHRESRADQDQPEDRREGEGLGVLQGA